MTDVSLERLWCSAMSAVTFAKIEKLQHSQQSITVARRSNDTSVKWDALVVAISVLLLMKLTKTLRQVGEDSRHAYVYVYMNMKTNKSV